MLSAASQRCSDSKNWSQYSQHPRQAQTTWDLYRVGCFQVTARFVESDGASLSPPTVIIFAHQCKQSLSVNMPDLKFQFAESKAGFSFRYSTLQVLSFNYNVVSSQKRQRPKLLTIRWWNANPWQNYILLRQEWLDALHIIDLQFRYNVGSRQSLVLDHEWLIYETHEMTRHISLKKHSLLYRRFTHNQLSLTWECWKSNEGGL